MEYGLSILLCMSTTKMLPLRTLFGTSSLGYLQRDGVMTLVSWNPTLYRNRLVDMIKSRLVRDLVLGVLAYFVS